MKNIHLLAAVLLLASTACNNTKKEESGMAKDGTQQASSSTPDSATMMKNWQAYMAPGDMHKMMASWDGNWSCTVSTWMQPGVPPIASTATAVNKMVLGGRYQASAFTGTFNGMPFEGMGTLAYDNAKKLFISTWMDNMGTGVMKMEGPWDPATKTMDLKGSMIDPSTGKEVTAHQMFTEKDANTQVMVIFAPGPGGKEYKSMEILFTRDK